MYGGGKRFFWKCQVFFLNERVFMRCEVFLLVFFFFFFLNEYFISLITIEIIFSIE
jgi:hypothetical protein